MTKKKEDKQPELAAEDAVAEDAAVEEVAEEIAAEQDESAAQEEGSSTPPEVAALIQDLAEAQTQRDEYLDGWQRATADFANYKKRIERDRQTNQQNQLADIVKRYLEVVDDLERALQARPQQGDGATWSEGVELIYRKMLNILESQGVRPMVAKGLPFDPNFHEAIGEVYDSETSSGHVADVVQNGYLINERVLRPALVRISS